MARELPPFNPVTLPELRRIWCEHRNEDTRRLVLEVERYRRMMAEIDSLYKSTHQAWRDTVGGNLIALHMLQKIMLDERMRLAITAN